MAKSKIKRQKRKVSIEMPSNVYQGANFSLQNLGTFKLDYSNYLYEIQKYHCLKLSESKFNKTLRLGEYATKLNLNLQEAVTLYYCFRLENITIGVNMDVYNFMVDYLSLVAIRSLDSQIEEIYPYWQKAKMAQMQAGYIETVKQEADCLMIQNLNDYE